MAKTISIDDRLSGMSLWLALGIVGGWLISRFSRRRQRAITVISEKADKSHPKPIRADRAKVPESGPGILSLRLELLGAVAIRLAQRYAKSWSAELVAQLKSSADVPTVPRSLTETGTSIVARPPSQSENAS